MPNWHFEEHYKLKFWDSIPNGIFKVTPQWHLWDDNPAYLQLASYEIADLFLLFKRSNTVGKCNSQFRQKTIALRSYGHNSTTTYGLTLSSGIETREKKGTKSAIKQLIEDTYEQDREETEEDNERTVRIRFFGTFVAFVQQFLNKHLSHRNIQKNLESIFRS